MTTNEPTLVYANTFDDGSYDNCELESMVVRRMSSPTPCIDFDWTTDGPGFDEIPNGTWDFYYVLIKSEKLFQYVDFAVDKLTFIKK